MNFNQKFKNSISQNALAIAKSKRFKDKFIFTATMFVLSNCGGGGGGGSSTSTSTTNQIR